MSTYFTNFINGLQHFVLAELQQKIDGIKIIDRDKERIIFRYSGDARHLLKLRSVEDLYFCLRHLKGGVEQFA